MIKTKIISFIVVLFTLLLSSCNEDKATVVDSMASLASSYHIIGL